MSVVVFNHCHHNRIWGYLSSNSSGPIDRFVTTLLGIAVVAVPIGILSSAFLEESKKEEET